MTTSHYFIFLAGLVLVDIAFIYGYFIYASHESYLEVHRKTAELPLPKAGSIQAALFIVATFCLYFLTPDKAWFYESKFLEFMILLAGFGALELITPNKKAFRIMAGVLQLGAIAAFIFRLPDNEIFSKTSLPPEAAKTAGALIWFAAFKLMTGLDRFEGIIYEQAFYVGFVFILAPFVGSAALTPFFQAGGLFFPLIFVLAPLFYILDYRLPLSNAARSVFCLAITGFAAFLVFNGSWGGALLLLSYPLFEGTVFVFRSFKRLVFRSKQPLFFYETIQNLGIPDKIVINFILRRNMLFAALALFILNKGEMQPQAVLIAALLYFKFYYNVTYPGSSKSSLFDLARQLKTDAKKTIRDADQSISQIKETYRAKNTQTSDSKENTTHEQP